MNNEVAEVLRVGFVSHREHSQFTFTPRSYETLEQLVAASYYCLNSDTIDEVGAVFGYLHGKPYYCELVFDGHPDAYYTMAIVPEITKQCRREEIASEIKLHRSNIESWQLLELLGRGSYVDAIIWAQRKVYELSSIEIK